MLQHTSIRNVKLNIYHAKPYCYVGNRCLFCLSLEIEMAEKQEFFTKFEECIAWIEDTQLTFLIL